MISQTALIASRNERTRGQVVSGARADWADDCADFQAVYRAVYEAGLAALQNARLTFVTRVDKSTVSAISDEQTAREAAQDYVERLYDRAEPLVLERLREFGFPELKVAK